MCDAYLVGSGISCVYTVLNYRCSGLESSLEDCIFNSWGVHDCGHGEDASVVCSGQLGIRSLPCCAQSGAASTAAMVVMRSYSHSG